MTNFFIEKLHLFIKRKLKRKGGKVWFRIVPFVGLTEKAVGVRMGKGKGLRNGWFYPIKKAQVFMELIVFDRILLNRILKGLKMKLPLKIKYIFNRK